MGWPEYIIIADILFVLTQGSVLYFQGKESASMYIGKVLGVSIFAGLLTWGGFWL